jgi:hypothetical protein
MTVRSKVGAACRRVIGRAAEPGSATRGKSSSAVRRMRSEGAPATVGRMLDWVERTLADRRVRLAADAGLAVVLTAAALVDITDDRIAWGGRGPGSAARPASARGRQADRADPGAARETAWRLRLAADLVRPERRGWRADRPQADGAADAPGGPLRPDHEEMAHAVSFGRGSVLGRYFISDGKTEIAPPAGVPANSSAKAF